MAVQASALTSIESLPKFLAARAAAGADVAVLWRRGRWMAVNRAVTHVADLPIGAPLEGAPADLNAKPWRVQPWAQLEEREREDVLRTVTACSCDQEGYTGCPYCRGERAAPKLELVDRDVLAWLYRGEVEARFRATVSGFGALMQVSLRHLSTAEPTLFAAQPVIRRAVRFGMLALDVAGVPMLVVRRAGNVATAHRLHRPAATAPRSALAKPRRRRGDYVND